MYYIKYSNSNHSTTLETTPGNRDAALDKQHQEGIRGARRQDPHRGDACERLRTRE